MGLESLAICFDKEIARKGPGFKSRDFKEMNSRLNYLTETMGVGLFTASPGMGKTFCLHTFAQSLNPGMYTVKYISHTNVSPMDFYKILCTTLGLSTYGTRPQLHNAIQDQIWYMYKEQRRPLILVVDEAQYLSNQVFDLLKVLLNRDYDSVNFFTLILSGEPNMNLTLSKPQHEAFRQRISVHYNFKGLSSSEVKEYIFYKMDGTGVDRSIISDEEIRSIHVASKGNPRIVDNIMSYALILAGQFTKSTLDEEVVNGAIQAQRLD